MKKITSEIYQVIKLNIVQVFLFEFFYRFVTGSIYLNLLGFGVKFALKMAGYSYLTAGNIGLFLIRPWTLATLAFLGIIGIFLLMLEAGALITAFQAAEYYRRISAWDILTGGFEKLIDEIKRRNVRLFFFSVLFFLLISFYLIYEILTHVKPVNFVLYELQKLPAGRMSAVLSIGLLIAAVLPGVYTLHCCMIEQKRFGDAYRQSWELVKGNVIRVLLSMILCHAAVMALFWAANAACTFVAAVFVTLFTPGHLALSVLLATADKVELILLFLAGNCLAVLFIAVLTVQYNRYSGSIERDGAWDFLKPRVMGMGRRAQVIIAATAAAVSLILIFNTVRNGSFLADSALNEIQITAHRGDSKSAPENTMAAIRLAFENMADYAEIDIQETSDGVLVLHHDSSLKRTAGINREVSSYTYEELAQVDVGSSFSPEFTGERIPGLREVMEYCKGRLNLNIEIKYAGKKSQVPERLVELIREYGMEEQCVVTSVSLDYLKRVKEEDSDIRTGFIVTAAYGNYYSMEGIDLISVRSSFVTEKLVEQAHEKGKAVHAWTVNTESELERMRYLKVDNIITDYPILAREVAYREDAAKSLLGYIRKVMR